MDADNNPSTFEYPDYVVRVFRDEQGRRVTQFIAIFEGAGLPNKANADLCAAAPEMYEALFALRAAIDGLGLKFPYLEACKLQAINALIKANSGSLPPVAEKDQNEGNKS